MYFYIVHSFQLFEFNIFPKHIENINITMISKKEKDENKFINYIYSYSSTINIL